MTAELDAATLRARYGEPLARETFRVRPNIEIVVGYGGSHQVCTIEFPVSVTRQEADEVIDELVPPTERGKEIGHGLKIIGSYSMSWVAYEHIMISESQGGPNGVCISFKRPDCH
jgi:hypothetical protein